MSSVLNSLPNGTWRKVQGSALVVPLDPNTLAPRGYLRSVGSCKFDLAVKNEYAEMVENQDPLRPVVYRRVVKQDVSFKLTLMQFEGPMLSAMHAAVPGVAFSQNAGAAKTVEYDGVVDGSVIELATDAGILAHDATGFAITDGANPLPNGTFRADLATGLVQIVNAPASGKVVATYVVPPVTGPGDSLLNMGSEPDFIAKVIVRQNNLNGVNFLYTLPKVQIPSAQTIQLIGNDNNFVNTELDCMVLYDSRYPGQERGWAAQIF